MRCLMSSERERKRERESIRSPNERMHDSNSSIPPLASLPLAAAAAADSCRRRGSVTRRRRRRKERGSIRPDIWSISDVGERERGRCVSSSSGSRRCEGGKRREQESEREEKGSRKRELGKEIQSTSSLSLPMCVRMLANAAEERRTGQRER